MSDCNYCSYRSMKRQGCRKATMKERKRLWDREAAKEGFMQQMGAGVVIVNKAGEFVAWFMKLPNHCCC